MTPTSGFAKFLRFIAIFFMALTAGFTIMGGAGTTCAALTPTKWDSMAPLASYQWLYILYVIITVAIGIFGIRAVVQLVKGTKNSYRSALFTLIAGIVVGTIHIITSRAIRGSSMPVDAVVYMTVLTLVIFLLIRIPKIWSGVDFTKAPKKEGKKNAGISTMALAVFSFTIQYWMANTHTWNGVNYADAFNATMTITGITLMVMGMILVSPIQLLKMRYTKKIENN